jgi:rhodanese-related sulfurtransferase
VIARLLKETVGIALCALVPALVSGALQLQWKATDATPTKVEWKKEEPLQEGEVRMATVQMWGDKVLWVDARAQQKYDADHVPGAVLLNEDNWDQQVAEFLNEWDPDKAVVVYCDGAACDASHAVRKRLVEDLQIPTVYVLKGGWTAWQSK